MSGQRCLMCGAGLEEVFHAALWLPDGSFVHASCESRLGRLSRSLSRTLCRTLWSPERSHLERRIELLRRALEEYVEDDQDERQDLLRSGATMSGVAAQALWEDDIEAARTGTRRFVR